ncbi:MAG TPA: nucleotide-binding protein [Pyrinomonadaceae bacterium]|jgi:predicted nucleotide-binding protein|nr:nucleotide-binding protein [Pyrinomonadaceae bacterium]
MGWMIEGDSYVLEQWTRKPFERFKSDATRGLMQGLAGLFTTHRWEGTTCYISAMGARSTLTFDHGHVVCRVRLTSFPATFLMEKILSDVLATTADVCGTISAANRNVFIVHGHSQERKAELKEFLFTLGLQPVILDEQDHMGKTVIEAFEYYATTCSFAFVLMTPDDAAEGEGRMGARRRARQNVIMELGWFIAYLGRERVAILYQGDPEIPSDINGVLYLEFKERIGEVSERIRARLRGVGLIP